MSDNSSLTVRQRRFLAALITGPNVREAAESQQKSTGAARASRVGTGLT